MEGICALCGRKLSHRDFAFDIENTAYRYCDRHVPFRNQVKNRLRTDVNSDLEQIILELRKTARNAPREFDDAVNLLVIEVKNEVLAETEERKLQMDDSTEYWKQYREKKEKEYEQIEKRRIEAIELSTRLQEEAEKLLLTTGSNFEGFVVDKYIDVFCEEVIFKNSIWNSLLAGMEDFGNSFSFVEREMSGATTLISNAREYVMKKFRFHAAQMGANAVLGIEFESSFGSDVVRVSISGTAVVIRKG